MAPIHLMIHLSFQSCWTFSLVLDLCRTGLSIHVNLEVFNSSRLGALLWSIGDKEPQRAGAGWVKRNSQATVWVKQRGFFFFCLLAKHQLVHSKSQARTRWPSSHQSHSDPFKKTCLRHYYVAGMWRAHSGVGQNAVIYRTDGLGTTWWKTARCFFDAYGELFW